MPLTVQRNLFFLFTTHFLTDFLTYSSKKQTNTPLRKLQIVQLKKNLQFIKKQMIGQQGHNSAGCAKKLWFGLFCGGAGEQMGAQEAGGGVSCVH